MATNVDQLKPVFTITPSILTDVAKIEAAKELISNASLIPAWERQFREEAMIRQVYHSTHIEGNPLNFTEAQNIFRHGLESTIEARDRDIQEIINYRNVVKYINDYQKTTVDETIFRNLHRLIVDQLLPADQAGQYRRVNVVIMNNLTKEAVFQPPAAPEVPGLVSRFFRWLDQADVQQLPAALKAGIGHYELVRIHPFVDGNGRTTRSMAMLMLYRDGYDMKQFFCLDEYYDRDAATYYAALQSANNSGDLTGWLEYFIHGLAVEFLQVKQRVVDLSRDHALKQKMGQIALNDRQVKLLTFLQDHGRIANIDWQTLIPGVSDDTILRDLKDLMKKRLVKKRGKTKAAYYVSTT